MASGVSFTIAGHEFKKRLHAAATELWRDDHPEFLVCWGKVGTYVPDQYVEFHGTDTGDEFATMGTNRSAEETIRLETQWFVSRFGDPENAGPEADEYLYARLAELEQYVRVTNTTLDGLVRHTRLVSYATDDAAMQRDNAQGRLSAALAMFEAKVRITA